MIDELFAFYWFNLFWNYLLKFFLKRILFLFNLNWNFKTFLFWRICFIIFIIIVNLLCLFSYSLWLINHSFILYLLSNYVFFHKIIFLKDEFNVYKFYFLYFQNKFRKINLNFNSYKLIILKINLLKYTFL